MMELLYRMPKNFALSGKNASRFFDNSGHLKNIRGLQYWPIKKVLVEKYRIKEAEAQSLADFLTPMLQWYPGKRATAQQMLNHPWLNSESTYEDRLTEKEYQI
jgi:serine/threonine-protein kinase SRPK3